MTKILVHANGIDGNGAGAESMAMGGTEVGWAQSPLEAMDDNPAGLGFLTENEFDLGGVGASAQGRFSKPSVGSSGALNESPEGLPEGALGIPLGQNISVGISFIPESMLLADWKYQDPPGGMGGATTYGDQTDKSEILVLRSAVGLGVRLNSQLSVGFSVGAVYNQNELNAPYIFQNVQPAGVAGLDGDKTLLDLDTSGFGWNAQLGLLYRPLANLQFGFSYQNKYTVVTTDSASGNAYAQFLAPPGSSATAFHYDAEVDNTFPDQVSLGGSWKFLPNWRLAAQVDWIDWAHSFNTLPVKLSNGSGVVVNAFGAAGSSFQDYLPLNWKNEFVYRVGLEYAVTQNLFLRGGYAYGGSPVPDSTLTPMTAVIMENTITAGVGYRWRACEFDLAYQYDLPNDQQVAASSLLSGEYSNSSTRVSINWLALTMKVKF